MVHPLKFVEMAPPPSCVVVSHRMVRPPARAVVIVKKVKPQERLAAIAKMTPNKMADTTTARRIPLPRIRGLPLSRNNV